MLDVLRVVIGLLLSLNPFSFFVCWNGDRAVSAFSCYSFFDLLELCSWKF